MIITYDVTRQDSFDSISNWVSQIETHAAPNIKKILVGNKIDLIDEREVSKE